MSGAIERFTEAARLEGLDPVVRRFPQGTKTAQDAARAIGCSEGQIVKSLVFMADEVPVLALTSGANRVDTRKVAALCRSEIVRRATPEEARAATGFGVGGTPPFGHTTRVATFVDEDLLAHDEVWAAAGTPDAVFVLPPARLVVLSHGTTVDLAERGIMEP